MEIATPVEISEIFEEGEVRGDGPSQSYMGGAWCVVTRSRGIQGHQFQSQELASDILENTYRLCPRRKVSQVLNSNSFTSSRSSSHQRYPQSTQYVSQIVSHHTRS